MRIKLSRILFQKIIANPQGGECPESGLSVRLAAGAVLEVMGAGGVAGAAIDFIFEG